MKAVSSLAPRQNEINGKNVMKAASRGMRWHAKGVSLCFGDEASSFVFLLERQRRKKKNRPKSRQKKEGGGSRETA